MSDDTPILSLPLILPAQAQKHVTHNEALRLLDVLVQLVVADRTRTEPPTASEDGDRHIIGDEPTGAWEGRSGWIASFWAGGWLYIRPRLGWSARVLAESRTVVYGTSGWVTEEAATAQGAAAFGINATADLTNRLTVSARATLLNHQGAGHQLKVNKAGSGDTASLLFQTGFLGRAEMGTVGDDDFRIRVSVDGADFTDGAVFSAQNGLARLVSGATVPDGSAAHPALAFDDDADTGLFRPSANTLGLAAGGSERARLTADGYLRLAEGTAGIQFGGQSGAAHALDAYEEGVFTPSVRGTATAGAATYAVQVGRYTRIGNRILFSIRLEWSGHSGSGTLQVAGLPEPAAAITGGFTSVQISQSGLSVSGAQLSAVIAPGATVINILQTAAGGAVTGVSQSVSGVLTLSGHYEA